MFIPAESVTLQQYYQVDDEMREKFDQEVNKVRDKFVKFNEYHDFSTDKLFKICQIDFAHDYS